MTIERMNYPDGYFPLEEFQARWKKVDAEMKARGYELAIVWGKTAGHYERSMETLWLTNFWSEHSGQEPDAPIWNARGFCCVILEPGKEPELHGDVASVRRRFVQCGEYFFSDDPVASVAKALVRRGVRGRVAFVGSDCLPVKYAKELEAATPGVDYVYDDNLIRACRRIKSPRELDLFREAGQMVSSALYRVCDSLYAGKTGAEAAAEGAYELTRRGGGWLRIPVNFGSDPDSAYFERDPMYGYPMTAPTAGEMIRTWIYGPIHQGYWIDPGRSLVCGGKPTPEQRSLLVDSYAITEAVLNTVRPGVKVLDVIAAVEKVKERVVDQKDLASDQWPYYGHGNGMMWEHPIINKDCVTEDDIFEEGMVASGESFMTRKNVGSVGWEQNFIVTSTGIELITTTPVFWF
ncbi:M24 family metallopeptidase [Paraburkholderia phytofirmans]|uniref:M24 family metallopeptidase n=1 Tax=Paraburkholderia phytofirmans TaxID=261302 RepID=UPI0038BB22FB